METTRKIYRDFMAAETARPEIQRQKKEFLNLHFQAGTTGIFSPGFLIPAFALMALCLFFSRLQIKFIPQVVLTEDFPGMRLKTAGEEAAASRPPSLPPVQVKRVTSRAGATLVYQKVFDDHELPITIIWVFPGGKNQ